jgi:hypothetical protein
VTPAPRLEQLVSDLGDLCTFQAEAERYPELRRSAEVETAQRRVRLATDAVARAAAHDDDPDLVERAWAAVASAQDAVSAARGRVASVRAARDRVEAAATAAREVVERAHGVRLARASGSSSVFACCAACGQRSRVSFLIEVPSSVVAQTFRCPAPECGGYLVVACPVSALRFRVELVGRV